MNDGYIQSSNSRYRKTGIMIFVIGITLSALGEIELVSILLKLPLTVIPKVALEDTIPFLPVVYLILGNCMMLIEYQFFRKTDPKEFHGIKSRSDYNAALDFRDTQVIQTSSGM